MMANGRTRKLAQATAVILAIACGSAVSVAGADSAPAVPKRPQRRLEPAEVRQIVDCYAGLYGIPERASRITSVIMSESRGFAAIRSRNGRFEGICQFLPQTFKVNVAAMKKAGALPPWVIFSTLEPEQAIQVMVWMWSKGKHRQWGPARFLAFAQPRPIQGPPLPETP